MSEQYDRDAHPYDRPKQSPEQQLRSLKIIWAAMLASPCMALGVFHFIRSSSPQPMANESMFPLVVIACVMAFVMPITGRFVAKAVVNGARSQNPVPHPAQVFMTSTIIAVALCEGPALLAAVAYFITGNRLALVGFAIAIGALITLRPTDERYASVQTALS
ncbi:MAG TPA: hypothetical protein VK447_09365 [Myxococcaceae bacterium]|nr:hypothetical protein [Myxococcaceae bacterium]